MKYFKAEYFNKLLKEYKISQGNLSDLTEISRVTLSSYQNSKTQPPIETIFLFAQILNIDYTSLIACPTSNEGIKSALLSPVENKIFENFILKTMKKWCKNCELKKQHSS